MDSEMDAVLSSIKSTSDRSVILTGDTNIDYYQVLRLVIYTKNARYLSALHTYTINFFLICL